MAMKCPSCGAENPDHAEFCNLCLSKAGFEDPEYTATMPKGHEGFHQRYPSSFSDDAPVIPPDETAKPEALPVDIGSYGVRTGEQVPEQPDPTVGLAAPVEPVDVGAYGQQSGQAPHEPGREEGYYVGAGDGRRKRRRKGRR